MGDRANVKVIDDGSRVFLYTHWCGSELPATLQSALKRGKERWDDGQYLARIIFCEMVGEAGDELTGFGISSVVGDGAERTLTVNVQEQTVSNGHSKKKATFTEYTAEDYEPSW